MNQKEKDRQLRLWLWLSLACRPGSALPSTLLKYFGSPEKIYQAEEEDFASLDVPFYGHEKDLLKKDLEKADAILTYCRKNGVGISTPDDYFYPEMFRPLPNKPMVLYHRGNFCDFDAHFCVSVVGKRKASNYGIHAAKRISYDLCRAGAVIVSGVASGVDAAAHRAALYEGTFTVGFIGCGIDRVYPKENEQLYSEIMEKGLLITEYPPGTPPYARNFPIRNRLISAFSDAVCVIEGNEQSGSLITAEDALLQKKPLYSVPGSIFAQNSAGSNFLLKVGAKPCLSAFDIIEDFRPQYPTLLGSLSLFGKKEKTPVVKREKKPNIKKKIQSYVFPGTASADEGKSTVPPEFEFIEVKEDPTEHKETRYKSVLPDLSPEEMQVYGSLGYEPCSIDQLVTGDLTVSTVMQILTKLEIKGRVRKAPGGKVYLTDSADV